MPRCSARSPSHSLWLETLPGEASCHRAGMALGGDALDGDKAKEAVDSDQALGPLSPQMAIVFNQEGLSAIQPPCVVQNFINHNAVLYKVFVVGESYTVVQRPSLKNFSAGTSGKQASHCPGSLRSGARLGHGTGRLSFGTDPGCPRLFLEGGEVI